MIALDTNILVYVDDSDDKKGRHKRAIALMDKLASTGVIISLQVLGEFLNVCCNKSLIALDAATNKASLYAEVFGEVPTNIDDLTTAALISARHRLQFFDSLIIAVARRAGATVLLSEDMQDGQQIDGLTIVNPFDDANAAVLASYLDGSG